MPDTLDDDDCFVNDDCPDQCNTDHEVSGDIIVCPETGDRWVRCHFCRENNGDEATLTYAWSEPRTIQWGIREIMVCNTVDHDLNECVDCSAWFFTDDGYFRDGEAYCEGCDPGPDEDFETYRNYNTGRAVETCNRCNTTNLHFEEIGERFLCDHRIAEIIEGQPFHPVKLARELVRS